jgi:RNA polymerase sigma factor for flagellar operon FliA
MKTDTALIREDPEQLFEKNIVNVRKLVECIYPTLPTHVDKDELLTIALEAMWKVIKRYDPDRNNEFWTFAVKRVSGSIYDELRKLDWMPRRTRRLFNNVLKKCDELMCKTGNAVGLWEACDALGIRKEQAFWLRFASQISFVSMQAPAAGEGDGEELGDTIPDESIVHPSDTIDGEDELARLHGFIDKFDEHTRSILRLYFWDENTLQKIADIFGVTDMCILKRIRRALERLRIFLTTDAC